jgi:hypothetical protein
MMTGGFFWNGATSGSGGKFALDLDSFSTCSAHLVDSGEDLPLASVRSPTMLNIFYARRYCTVAACLALLVAVVSPVTVTRAQEARTEESGPKESRGREGISEDVAVAMVREQTDGKVVRVDRKLDGGSVYYRVRVLSPDGRLREFRVDAATGAIR